MILVALQGKQATIFYILFTDIVRFKAQSLHATDNVKSWFIMMFTVQSFAWLQATMLLIHFFLEKNFLEFFSNFCDFFNQVPIAVVKNQ